MKEKIKNLFSTPKKAVLTIVCIAAVLAVLGVGTVFAAGKAAESSSIGADNAQNFAFADAGVDPAAASDVSVEFDYEQGQFVYDVEFTYDGTEYTYWIKASDGSVVKKRLEIVEKGTGEEDTAETESSTAASADESVTLITKSEAKEIALADAGLDESEITQCEIEKTTLNGIIVYDIEFESADGAYDYDYVINAASGAILSSDVEEEDENSSAQQTTQEQTTAAQTSAASETTTAQSSELIGKSKAKSIALSDAGVSASELTEFDIKLDYDNGVRVYEIEFETSAAEYEYEINAYTGSIVSKDSETKKSSSSEQTTTSGSSSVISLSEAKTIAAEHAGYSVSEVTFSKAKLDTEDGIQVYEIEFIKGNYEYEYEINAATGAIIEYDVDYDD